MVKGRKDLVIENGGSVFLCYFFPLNSTYLDSHPAKGEWVQHVLTPPAASTDPVFPTGLGRCFGSQKEHHEENIGEMVKTLWVRTGAPICAISSNVKQ